MKDSITRIALILLVFTLSLVSCSKSVLFQPVEERISGEWKFEQVKFRENNTISRDDVTESFEDVTLEFSQDNILVRSNDSTNEVSEGSWDIISSQNGDTFDNLTGIFIDFEGNSTELLNWELTSVTATKIRAEEQKDGGIFYYRLVKN